MEFISLNQYQLRIQRIYPQPLTPSLNCKPTLVFLHDAIGSIEQWRAFPEKLSKRTGCPALLYDRIGYGGSSPSAECRGLHYLEEEAISFLPEVLRLCEVKDCILIGHSDGGSIALIFAATSPPHIQLRGVITEAAHVFVEEITLAGIRNAETLAKSGNFLEKLSKFHGEKTRNLFEAWTQTWLAPGYRSWNIEKYLSQITCPSLIIQGEQDEYGTLQQVEAITQQVRGPSRPLVLSECGHIPHYQAQEKVLEEMQNFISNLS